MHEVRLARVDIRHSFQLVLDVVVVNQETGIGQVAVGVVRIAVPADPGQFVLRVDVECRRRAAAVVRPLVYPVRYF